MGGGYEGQQIGHNGGVGILSACAGYLAVLGTADSNTMLPSCTCGRARAVHLTLDARGIALTSRVLAASILVPTACPCAAWSA